MLQFLYVYSFYFNWICCFYYQQCDFEIEIFFRWKMMKNETFFLMKTLIILPNCNIFVRRWLKKARNFLTISMWKKVMEKICFQNFFFPTQKPPCWFSSYDISTLRQDSEKEQSKTVGSMVFDKEFSLLNRNNGAWWNESENRVVNGLIIIVHEQ